MSDTSTNPMPKSAAAIVGIILGAIALLTSFLPIINNFSFFFALIGVVFGVVGLVGTMKGKKSGKGLAIASVIVNILAIVIVLATQSMYSAALDEAVSDATLSTTDGTVVSAETTSADSTSADAAADDSASKYTIADEALDGDEWSSKITGTFTNTSGKEFSYISVSYNLYDADGNQIGTAIDSTSNLADGGTWKFEAYGTEPLADVANYMLADVSGF